jgi:hypothetical protein
VLHNFQTSEDVVASAVVVHFDENLFGTVSCNDCETEDVMNEV